MKHSILYDYILLPYTVSSAHSITYTKELLFAMLYKYDEAIYNKVKKLSYDYRDRVVFGIKEIYDTKSHEYEFYIYNQEKNITIPSINIKEFINAHKDLFGENIIINIDVFESLEYFMFSFEFDKCSKKIEYIDIYNRLGNYRVSNGKITKRNTYNFYPKSEMKNIIIDIKNSIFKQKKVKELLHKKFFESLQWDICIAKKQATDCIYFRRVDYDAFVYFLDYFNYCNDIKTFIQKNQCWLKDIYFDIWYDYIIKNNTICYTKTWFYGFF